MPVKGISRENALHARDAEQRVVMPHHAIADNKPRQGKMNGDVPLGVREIRTLDTLTGDAEGARLVVTVRDREARALLRSAPPPCEQVFDLLDDPDEWLTRVHKALSHSIDHPKGALRVSRIIAAITVYRPAGATGA
jgi:hypothetical protein